MNIGLTMPPELSAALFDFQTKVPPILKNSEAGGERKSYRYADLPSIVKVIRPLLAEVGLGFSQAIGELSADGILCVDTTIFHKSGTAMTFRSSAPVPPTYVRSEDGQIEGSFIDPHKFGSIATYLSRYALTKALGIVTDEDDDAARARPENPRDAVGRRASARKPAPESPHPGAQNGRPAASISAEEHKFLTSLPEDIKEVFRARRFMAREVLAFAGFGTDQVLTPAGIREKMANLLGRKSEEEIEKEKQ